MTYVTKFPVLIDVAQQTYIHCKNTKEFEGLLERRKSPAVPETPENRVRTGAAGLKRRTSTAVAEKPKKKKKPKKNAQLVLRLEQELRDRFIDACQDLDTTAAREVRRFIKRFLKRYDRGDFDE